MVLEERRDVAQERVRFEAVGGGLLFRLLGRRQGSLVEVVGDVEDGEQDEQGECTGLLLGGGGGNRCHCR